MRPKKATIRLHAKLGPQTAVYRKKEYGAISAGHSDKGRRDVVASGGDYEEASFANDYDDFSVQQSTAKFGSGFQHKSPAPFKNKSKQLSGRFGAPLGKDTRRFKRGGSGHAQKKA